MMKHSKKQENKRNVVLFFVAFVITLCIAIVLIYLEHGKQDLGPTPSSSPTGTNDIQAGTGTAPEGSGNSSSSSPEGTQDIIIPASDAPVYIGYSSQIDVEASNNDYIAAIIREKLMQMNFYRASSGQLDSVTDFAEAFETITFDNYVQVRIRSSSEDTIKSLYRDLLTLVYEHGAFKYSPPQGATPVPTPTPRENDSYSYLTVNIFKSE